jgi:hypothetical protein
MAHHDRRHLFHHQKSVGPQKFEHFYFIERDGSIAFCGPRKVVLIALGSTVTSRAVTRFVRLRMIVPMIGRSFEEARLSVNTATLMGG